MYSLSLWRALGAARFFSLSFLALAAPAFCDACGISWMRPNMPFAPDGSYRFVYWETLGEIPVKNAKVVEDGKKLALPINLGFSPAEGLVGLNNGLLGPGWSLALFESVLIPQDDETFLVRLPDGCDGWIWREKNTDRLEGFGWKGKIERNKTTLQANCGWELIYDKGNKLKRMKSPDGTRFEYVADAAGNLTLTADGKPLAALTVIRDRKTGKHDYELAFADKKALLKLGESPVLSGIHGKKENRNTLVAVQFAGEKERRFDRGSESLNINGEVFEWAPDTQQLTKDNKDAYAVIQINGVTCLKTTRSGGRVFLSGEDRRRGISVSQVDGGEIFVTELFPGGSEPAGGKVRRIYSVFPDGREKELHKQFWYDENGDLKRIFEKSSEGDIVYEFTKRKTQAVNNKTKAVLFTIEYDENNRMISFAKGGKLYKFSYRDENCVDISFEDGTAKKQITLPADKVKTIFENFQTKPTN